MQYRLLGRTGVKVSPLTLGTMMFGGPTDEATSTRIIHEALDRGINMIDTANMYSLGQSETVVGKALRDRRHRAILATKGRQKMGDGPNESGASRLHLMRELDASLKRLGTDFVDIYYVHAPDPTTPIDETLRALDDMVRNGKVHYLACSNFRAWQLCEALWASDQQRLKQFVCTQPLYNLVNRDIEVELLPLCQARGIGVISYSPLARGILTGKYEVGVEPPAGSRAARNDARMRQAEWRDASLLVAQKLREHCHQRGLAITQFALAWCLANPNITSIILGPRTPEQFADNLGCLDVQITAADEAFVDQLVPPGEHSGQGFQDTAYPITGRGV
ncbi:MAG: aldo/keto reductase [Planctomycetota bacterium]